MFPTSFCYTHTYSKILELRTGQHAATDDDAPPETTYLLFAVGSMIILKCSFVKVVVLVVIEIHFIRLHC